MTHTTFPIRATATEAEHQAHLRRAVVASTVGTTIEWYEFSDLQHDEAIDVRQVIMHFTEQAETPILPLKEIGNGNASDRSFPSVLSR